MEKKLIIIITATLILFLSAGLRLAYADEQFGGLDNLNINFDASNIKTGTFSPLSVTELVNRHNNIYRERNMVNNFAAEFPNTEVMNKVDNGSGFATESVSSSEDFIKILSRTNDNLPEPDISSGGLYIEEGN